MIKVFSWGNFDIPSKATPSLKKTYKQRFMNLYEKNINENIIYLNPWDKVRTLLRGNCNTFKFYK